MQKENYVEAEDAYRKALVIGPDNNKMCNLGICLMKQGRIAEAKETLKQVKPAAVNGLRGADSHLKAYERAQEMLRDLESKLRSNPLLGQGQNWLFDAFLGSSTIWQPQPCIDHPTQRKPEKEKFGNENGRGAALNRSNSLNIDAPPFYSSRLLKEINGVSQFHDPMGKLKRSRSGNVAEKSCAAARAEEVIAAAANKRRSLSSEDARNSWPELPDDKDFDEAILAAVLAPVLEDENSEANNKKDHQRPPPLGLAEGKMMMGKRLRAFEDITLGMNSPKAKVVA